MNPNIEQLAQAMHAQFLRISKQMYPVLAFAEWKDLGDEARNLYRLAAYRLMEITSCG